MNLFKESVSSIFLDFPDSHRYFCTSKIFDCPVFSLMQKFNYVFLSEPLSFLQAAIALLPYHTKNQAYVIDRSGRAAQYWWQQ